MPIGSLGRALGPAQNVLSYLASNPMYLLRSARNAVRREITIPLDLLRWAIGRRPRGKGPERIDLLSADPALGLGLTVDLYGTKLEVSAHVAIEGIEPHEDALKVTLRVSDLALTAPPNSPAAMMVQSLDLSRPAALLNMMPARHNALVDAQGDRFVLDLLKIKALGKNPRLRRLLTALSFLRIEGARVENDVLVLPIGVSPLKAPSAFLRAASL